MGAGRTYLAAFAGLHQIELLRAAVTRESKRRPSATRLRAGFVAIAPDLHGLSWPIED